MHALAVGTLAAGVLGTAVSGGVQWTHFAALDRLSWAALAGMALAGWAGQFLRTKGLALEKAAPAMLMRFLDIPFAFAWQAGLLRQRPALTAVCGALVICSCAVASVAIKWRRSSSDGEGGEQECKGMAGAGVGCTPTPTSGGASTQHIGCASLGPFEDIKEHIPRRAPPR